MIADEEAAQFFTARGEEALTTQKFEEAKEHFERALSEQDGFLPARVGLAEALAGLGEKEKAGDLLARCLEHETEPGLMGEELEAVQRARARLADLDPLRLDYLALVRAFRKKVLALARNTGRRTRTWHSSAWSGFCSWIPNAGRPGSSS